MYVNTGLVEGWYSANIQLERVYVETMKIEQ